MKKFLRGTKASLITLSNDVNDPTARQPAVGVFMSLSEGECPMKIKNGGNNVSAFVIHDIRPASSKEFDGRVKVFFYAPSRENKKKVVEYNFIIPIQYIATSMSLSAVEEPLGGLPIVFFDKEDIKLNEKITMDIFSSAFFLIFPMKESQDNIDLSDKMEELIAKPYTTALAPVPWDMITSTGGEDPNPNLSTAQGIMFNHLIALARGDMGALMEIMAMEKYLDAAHGGDLLEVDDDVIDLSDDIIPHEDILSDSEDEEDDIVADMDALDSEESFEEQVEQAKFTIYPLCFTIANTMMERIKGFNPKIKGIAMRNPEVVTSVEYEPWFDLEFNALTSSLEDIFKGENFGSDNPEDIQRRENIAYWEAPIDESCPSMKPLFEYLDAQPDKDIYREILNADFNDNDEAHKILARYGVGKCFTAMTMLIASYALKKGTLLSQFTREVVPAPEIISSWIGVSDTDFVWELPSLAHSLAQYNVSNTVDVLSMYYKPANEMENAIYLWNSINYITHLFQNHDFWSNMSKEEFKGKLDKLEDNTSESLKFKKWLESFFSVIKNDTNNTDPEKQNEIHGAIHEFFNSEEDITVLATYVAKTFIAFADIATMNQELTADDPEWNVRRIVILNHILTGVAEHTGKRVEFVIR